MTDDTEIVSSDYDVLKGKIPTEVLMRLLW